VKTRGIGAERRRLEDARLLTGQGCYSDDFSLPGQAHGVVLRSPHPHARIVSVDTARASKMPGVLLVLTGANVLADGLKPIPHIPTAMSPPDIGLYNLDGTDLLPNRCASSARLWPSSSPRPWRRRRMRPRRSTSPTSLCRR
jgi:CO/xanthine dehydrogenase Mo-binding subunit